MCGIVGIAHQGGILPESAIRAMTAGIPYRGPDGVGHLSIDGVSLGHRRLSVIDPTEAGAQPMSSQDGKCWIVFNGEIYNYVEIRKELIQLGWSFQSGSDTEVLLCAYQQWGDDCLGRFMGMYAFAIWDEYERRLLIARDRLGIKPLYYQEIGERLIFGSEIKSLLAVRESTGGVDESLIDAYMSFGYVPGEDTLHHGIRRLLPAHSLVWHDGRVSVRRYWDLGFGDVSSQSFEEVADTTRGMLRDSIALHLRSDVPLGVFLSGGLDSSSVVALLSKDRRDGINTFSVAYDFGADYDETPYARQVAKAFSTTHHEVRVTPQEFVDFIPKFIWHMDEPVTEAAAISLYYVSKLAREHVVVCLSGEGADELFAGYDFYTYNLVIESLRRGFGTLPFSWLSNLPGRAGLMRKIRKYAELAKLPLDQRYRGISSYEESSKDALYDGEFSVLARQGNDGCRSFLADLFDRSRHWDPLSRMLYFDTKTWLVDDLLIKADRMSMATSIELRVPFLDHRLVEYAAAVPSDYKIQRRNTKAVLKQGLRRLLPEQIIQRKKMGFPTPLEIMFKGALFDYAYETLLATGSATKRYFDSVAVERLLSEHRAGKSANHREIWQLIVLEEWHRVFGY